MRPFSFAAGSTVIAIEKPLARAGAALTAACSAILLQAFYRHDIGLTGGGLVAALAVLTWFRPFHGLLWLAALGPLSAMLGALAQVRPGGLRLLEALTLAFLTGWALHRTTWPRRLRVQSGLLLCGWLLVAAAVGSTIVSVAAILAEQLETPWSWQALTSLLHHYPIHWDPLAASLLLAGGVLLTLAVADTCAADDERRWRVLSMMVLGAAAAALLNVLRIVVAAAATGDFWPVLLTYAGTLRVNVHHHDLNAAGSYFAMMLFLAGGLVARNRLLGAATIATIAAGMWLAGSRVAMGAGILTAFALGFAALRRRGWRPLVLASIGLVALAAAALVLVAGLSQARHAATPGAAVTIRLALAKAALLMAAEHPWFGVGLGHFHAVSETYVDLPLYITRENAHNNFLQVLAELGVPGLVLFLAVVVASLGASWRRSSPLDTGLIAGLVVYLLTCLGGHPLLVPHAAYPFWLALGLSAAAAGPQAAWTRPRKLVMAAALLALAVSLPWRISESSRTADLANASRGLSLWQHDADGGRYRWAGGRATFFVPSSARMVGLPLRHGAETSGPLEVIILVNGREADRLIVRPEEGWRTVRLVPGPDRGRRFAQVDLEVREPGGDQPLEAPATDAGGPILVGRPVVR